MSAATRPEAHFALRSAVVAAQSLRFAPLAASEVAAQLRNVAAAISANAEFLDEEVRTDAGRESARDILRSVAELETLANALGGPALPPKAVTP